MPNPLIKKFQIKEEYSVLLMNSNPNIHPLFEGIRVEYKASKGEEFDSVILFTKSEQEILDLVPQAEANKKKEGLLWLSYPKQSGTIPGELNRDRTWEALKALGLAPVRLISVNDDWSSMRIKKEDEQKKESKFGQDPPGVDRSTKVVVPPEDLQKALNSNPKAKEFFESLSFSHKREYVGWIHQAKKEETRQRRVQKTIELLLEGKKTK